MLSLIFVKYLHVFSTVSCDTSIYTSRIHLDHVECVINLSITKFKFYLFNFYHIILNYFSINFVSVFNIVLIRIINHQSVHNKF